MASINLRGKRYHNRTQTRCGRGYATVAGGVRHGHATATVAVATPPPPWPRRGATVVANPQWPVALWRRLRRRHSATRQCVLATVAPAAAFLDGCSRFL